MAKLSLGVASNDVQVINLRQKVGLLLICCEINERVCEHRLVKKQGILTGEHVGPTEMILILLRVV